MNLQDTPEGREGVIREAGLTYPQVVDADNTIARAWGIRALPTVVLVDRHGTVRHQGHSLPSADALEEALRN